MFIQLNNWRYELSQSGAKKSNSIWILAQKRPGKPVPSEYRLQFLLSTEPDLDRRVALGFIRGLIDAYE